MIISIASGKGGTGKTTVATSLALSLSNAQILDCDVEEPNSHIFIKPENANKEFVSIPVPQINKAKCDYCGRCQEVCAYNAIAVIKKDVLVFSELCHGCGSCAYFCSQNAIQEVEKQIGVVEFGENNGLQFAYGKLNIGEAMAPPLIRAVKKHIDPSRIAIIDAPPGTSCPVIESIRESDFCILVTEPTPFGLNDLTLAVEVLFKLKISFGVIINRSDLGDDKTDRFCKDQNIPVLMRIPFQRKIAEGYSKGKTIVETLPEYKGMFQEMFRNLNIKK
ncbi:MAG: ATP-binding protein [Candidatus Aceula lacicola]|nr:ATP-binding protein [Candidatus Aceula lacicola]